MSNESSSWRAEEDERRKNSGWGWGGRGGAKAGHDKLSVGSQLHDCSSTPPPPPHLTQWMNPLTTSSHPQPAAIWSPDLRLQPSIPTSTHCLRCCWPIRVAIDTLMTGMTDQSFSQLFSESVNPLVSQAATLLSVTASLWVGLSHVLCVLVISTS